MKNCMNVILKHTVWILLDISPVNAILGMLEMGGAIAQVNILKNPPIS